MKKLVIIAFASLSICVAKAQDKDLEKRVNFRFISLTKDKPIDTFYLKETKQNWFLRIVKENKDETIYVSKKVLYPNGDIKDLSKSSDWNDEKEEMSPRAFIFQSSKPITFMALQMSEGNFRNLFKNIKKFMKQNKIKKENPDSWYMHQIPPEKDF